MVHHPDPVPQQRTTCEHAGRVDGQNSNAASSLAVLSNYLVHESALAGPGRTSNADGECLARMWIQFLNQLSARLSASLDYRDRFGNSAMLALEHLRR